MPAFPSIQWFDALREAVNEDARFRSLGTCDAKVGIKTEQQAFLITFEAFECAGVEEIDEDSLRDADFYLDLSTDEWQEFLSNIQTNGKADSEHSLNNLDLSRPSGMVKSHDEYRRHSFLRYHLSLQAFFDASATLETTFG
ncbi:MAG: hypothetical protein IIB15_09370 [Chloroflexi bacterium]|nr:hypothetical protein [Chloroflexota bacterium]